MKLPTSAFAALAVAFLPLAVAADSKVAKFAKLAKAGKGVIALNDALYEEITSAPRNYSVSVILTALGPQFKCAPCAAYKDRRYALDELTAGARPRSIFDPELRLVAGQWQKQPAAIRDTHFFASLDFMQGQNTFRKLGLTSAPNARHYPPTAGQRSSSSKEPVIHDFNRGGAYALSAEGFTSSLTSSLSLPSFFKRPPNYGKIATITVGLLTFLATTIVAWPVVSALIGNRYVWAILTLPFILLMCSGYMWNQIRHPPWATQNDQGGTNYFAGGYSNQYGVETQIISCIYAILAFSAYTLAFTVPKLEDQARQRAAIYIWLGVFVVMASLLLSVFKLKNGGYPYKLLF